MKERIKAMVLSKWKEFLILLLFFAFVFTANMWWNKSKEYQTLKETNNRLEKIDAIDNTLKAMQDRQEQIYPKLDQTLVKLGMARKEIQILEGKLPKPDNVAIHDNAAKLGLSELSVEFAKKGYSNKPVKVNVK